MEFVFFKAPIINVLLSPYLRYLLLFCYAFKTTLISTIHHFYFPHSGQTDLVQLHLVWLTSRICSPNQGLPPVCPSALGRVFFMFIVSVTSDPKHRGLRACVWKYFKETWRQVTSDINLCVYMNNKSIARVFFFQMSLTFIQKVFNVFIINKSVGERTC